MRRLVLAAERAIGPAPRRPTDALRSRLSPPAERPSWVASDVLRAVYDRQEDLITRGEVALAALVMANNALFQPGPTDAPGEVLYTFDPVLQAWPEQMAQAASELYKFHETGEAPPRDPWLRLLLDRMYTGRQRSLHERLPPEITGGFVAYHSSVIFFRQHLQDRVLRDQIFPVLVLRDGPALVVPHALWGGA